MDVPLSKKKLVKPGEKEQEALVSLLADDDPAVHESVRNHILSLGQQACGWLRPFTLNPDPVIRARVQELVRVLGRQDGDERFLTFCQHNGEDLDLELATGLLAQTEYPDINLDGYKALYDTWAGELKTRIDFKWDPETILRTVNTFFFQDLAFSGMEQYSHFQESSYINCVVDSRTGNPISLCTLYLFLTRRLCLPVAGIGLPGHFICRFQTTTCEIYIDVFRQGRFLRRADCMRFLIETCHNADQSFLAPVSPKRMLSRMCANLHQTYSNLELADPAARFQRYLIALAR